MTITLSRTRAPAITRTMVAESIETSSPVCGERYLHVCQSRTNAQSAPFAKKVNCSTFVYRHQERLRTPLVHRRQQVVTRLHGFSSSCLPSGSPQHGSGHASGVV